MLNRLKSFSNSCLFFLLNDASHILRFFRGQNIIAYFSAHLSITMDWLATFLSIEWWTHVVVARANKKKRHAYVCALRDRSVAGKRMCDEEVTFTWILCDHLY